MGFNLPKLRTKVCQTKFYHTKSLLLYFMERKTNTPFQFSYAYNQTRFNQPNFVSPDHSGISGRISLTVYVILASDHIHEIKLQSAHLVDVPLADAGC